MFKPALFAAALTLAASSSMAATTVDVTFTDNDYSFYSGSFTATDLNGDGIIELDEVTSFITSLGTSTPTYFGDYDYLTDTWIPTRSGDYLYDTTVGSHTLALTAGDDLDLTTTVVSVVPEPASASMMALGLVGALAWRARSRRRAASGAA